MTLTTDIRAALEAHLATVPGIPDRATHWAIQNDDFQPPVGEPWIRVRLATGFREPLTAPAEGAWIEMSGLLFVDLYFPIDTGSAAADALGDALVERFPYGQEFAVGGSTLRLLRSVARGGAREDDWYAVPAEVGWIIHTVNALVA